MFKSKQRIESDTDFVIRWADELIKTSPYTGIIDNYCFSVAWNSRDSNGYENPAFLKSIEVFRVKAMREVIGGDNSDYRLDAVIRILNEYFDKVRLHLLINEYIKIPIAPGFEWISSENGRLNKRLGGHKKYIKYRERELRPNKLRNAFLVSLISIALGSAFSFLLYKLQRRDAIEDKNIIKPPLDTTQSIQPPRVSLIDKKTK
jgi:hypothetical protein